MAPSAAQRGQRLRRQCGHRLCGLKTKNTLHTIEDARKAQDLGAIGVQIDLPIFHHPTQDDIVRFFSEISDAIDIGIVLYNTWWFGAPSITAASVRRLAAAEHVVAIKWATPPEQDYDDMRESPTLSMSSTTPTSPYAVTRAERRARRVGLGCHPQPDEGPGHATRPH